jgi:Icc-related predicted phosphoesterase
MKIIKNIACLLLLLFNSISAQISDVPESRIEQIDLSEKPVILLGDTQETSIWEFWREKNTGLRKIILDKIGEENPEFIVLLGDGVFQGSSSEQWAGYLSDAKMISKKNITVYPIMGNHEYFGSYDFIKSNIASVFPQLKGMTWYSVKAGALAFIFLNSNFSELSDLEVLTQNEWYIKTINEFEKDESVKGIVVAAHHPPYTNSTVVSADGDVRIYFVSGFLKMEKPGMFFSGHCHSYEHFIENGKHFIVSGGGGGPRHELETDKSVRKYDDKYDGGSIRDFHFCRLFADKDKIRVEVVFYSKENKSWYVGDIIELAI